MERQYLVTERAHFMCPNMHFGMKVKVKKTYDRQLLEESLIYGQKDIMLTI